MIIESHKLVIYVYVTTNNGEYRTNKFRPTHLEFYNDSYSNWEFCQPGINITTEDYNTVVDYIRNI